MKSVYVDSPLIGGFMFTRCTALTSLTISKNVTTIKEHCINYCGRLKEITYEGTLADLKNITGYKFLMSAAYCDTFITGLTACDSAADGEYYLCWVGRSNNMHPIVREVKAMN